MRTLIMGLFSVGFLLGADEVGLTFAAKGLCGTTSAAAPLLALWAAGSFAGGCLLSRVPQRSARAASLILGLAALAIGHLALIPACTNFVTLAAAVLLAGMAISPTEAAAYAVIDAAVPDERLTEAFSWMLTSAAIGISTGAAAAGLLVTSLGPAAVFALSSGACASAALVTALRAETLPAACARGRSRAPVPPSR